MGTEVPAPQGLPARSAADPIGDPSQWTAAFPTAAGHGCEGLKTVKTTESPKIGRPTLKPHVSIRAVPPEPRQSDGGGGERPALAAPQGRRGEPRGGGTTRGGEPRGARAGAAKRDPATATHAGPRRPFPARRWGPAGRQGRPAAPAPPLRSAAPAGRPQGTGTEGTGAAEGTGAPHGPGGPAPTGASRGRCRTAAGRRRGGKGAWLGGEAPPPPPRPRPAERQRPSVTCPDGRTDGSRWGGTCPR